MTRLLEPPEGRQVFRRAFEPLPHHIDANGHVNNVVYLDWAQQLAIAHWDSRAPEDERARWAWIAIRHEVDYRRPLVLGETATGRTWVAEASEGPRFDRFVRIDGPDGQMCAQVRTVWVLIEQSSGRPRRVPDWMVRTFA